MFNHRKKEKKDNRRRGWNKKRDSRDPPVREKNPDVRGREKKTVEGAKGRNQGGKDLCQKQAAVGKGQSREGNRKKKNFRMSCLREWP